MIFVLAFWISTQKRNGYLLVPLYLLSLLIINFLRYILPLKYKDHTDLCEDGLDWKGLYCHLL